MADLLHDISPDSPLRIMDSLHNRMDSILLVVASDIPPIPCPAADPGRKDTVP